ncbi:hypothetical protein PRVXT_000755 [Proteinivorax tanatarense]|uniref:Uncharacterized protein n=1 Tax=Proteinivorax tanatarense TaxID=1260629 RepID=A0AAU7VNI8_9FIRM
MKKNIQKILSYIILVFMLFSFLTFVPQKASAIPNNPRNFYYWLDNQSHLDTDSIVFDGDNALMWGTRTSAAPSSHIRFRNLGWQITIEIPEVGDLWRIKEIASTKGK